MSSLERRDRRRAKAIVRAWDEEQSNGRDPNAHKFAVILHRLIASALRREREETGFAAIRTLWGQTPAERKATRRKVRKAGAK